MQIPFFFTAVAAFFLVLGPLVVLHELGHYLAGRLFGVRADAFSIGFGKELWGRTDKRGTRWKISAIPMGGYVQFAGDMNAAGKPDPSLREADPETLKGTFPGAKLWQRALIVFAGPFANFLIAVLIFAGFAMAYGVPDVAPVVRGFASESDARAAGLRFGDRITAIDGSSVADAIELSQRVSIYPGSTIEISVIRDGKTLSIPVKLRSQTISDGFGNTAKVADLGIEFSSPVIDRVVAGMAADRAGLRAGDTITSIEGEAIGSFNDVRDFVRTHPDKSIRLGVLRDGAVREFHVVLGSEDTVSDLNKRERTGLLGISSGQRIHMNPATAVAFGVKESFGMVQRTAIGLKQIVVGDRSVQEMGGPIKIAQFSGQNLSLGWESFVGFAATISINLAFINLLPIPVLDGGHLALYAAEAVRRRPLGARSQEWAFRAGLAFVLVLALFVTFNDLASLPIFGS